MRPITERELDEKELGSFLTTDMPLELDLTPKKFEYGYDGNPGKGQRARAIVETPMFYRKKP